VGRHEDEIQTLTKKKAKIHAENNMRKEKHRKIEAGTNRSAATNLRT